MDASTRIMFIVPAVMPVGRISKVVWDKWGS